MAATVCTVFFLFLYFILSYIVTQRLENYLTNANTTTTNISHETTTPNTQTNQTTSPTVSPNPTTTKNPVTTPSMNTNVKTNGMTTSRMKTSTDNVSMSSPHITFTPTPSAIDNSNISDIHKKADCPKIIKPRHCTAISTMAHWEIVPQR